MNRRASLPGVDALFGTSDPGLKPPAAANAETAPEPPSRPLLTTDLPESDGVRGARERLAGQVEAPDAAVAALLRWAAVTCGARTAVEVGAAGGISGLTLLEALPERGVLTSIEPDGHAHGLAMAAYRDVGAGSRVRSINGEPATVLPRLTDGGYDLLLWQVPVDDPHAVLGHARRLLRPGGILLARGLVADEVGPAPAQRFLADLVDDIRFRATVLPVDGGVALATRQA
ncbi:O-methyltransferase [Egicoccus sp. AB-alg2]|uniref:O-methyltransferase n=1 Tax=Egicoccus sp. AB-alg2 TaxID=3242693 RepID=UPI00359E6873